MVTTVRQRATAVTHAKNYTSLVPSLDVKVVTLYYGVALTLLFAPCARRSNAFAMLHARKVGTRRARWRGVGRSNFERFTLITLA